LAEHTVFAAVVTFGTGVSSSRGKTKTPGGDIDTAYQYAGDEAEETLRRFVHALFPVSLRYDLSPNFLPFSFALSFSGQWQAEFKISRGMPTAGE
jgi:hypothetical protein